VEVWRVESNKGIRATVNEKSLEKALDHNLDVYFSKKGTTTELTEKATKFLWNLLPGWKDVWTSVVEVLVKKAVAAADKLDLRHIAVCGGVAANSALRAGFADHQKKHKLHMASPLLCTDNGVMIAVAGYYKYHRGPKRQFQPEPLSVDSTLAVESWG
jgi:tRNA A37 threonylcarbamoyltransferase TsaD